VTSAGEETPAAADAVHAAASPPPPPGRSALADQVMKWSIAAAILCAGLGVGYYFAFFLPQKEAQARADAQAAAAAQAKAQQDAQTKRTAAYNNCVTTAQQSYHSDWNSNCSLKADEQENNYRACLGQTFSSPEQCRSNYPELDRIDCSLPMVIANSLNDQLDKAKARCLDQAKSGLIG